MVDKSIQVVVPMGGKGLRVSKLNSNLPKPLLPLFGRKLFEIAIASLGSILNQSRLIFVVREDISSNSEFGRLAEKYLDTMTDLIILTENTRSVLETIQQVVTRLDPNKPLIVLDSDIYFKSNEFEEFISSESYLKYQGCVITFQSQNSSFSFVQTNESGIAADIAEKKVISDRALVGCYFFSRAETYLLHSSKFVTQVGLVVQEEHYVSSVIKSMLDDGMIIRCLNGEFLNFGDTDSFLENSSKIKNYFR